MSSMARQTLRQQTVDLWKPSSCLIGIVILLSGCEDPGGPQSTSDLIRTVDHGDHTDEAENHTGTEVSPPPKVSPTGPWPKAVSAVQMYDFGRMRLHAPDKNHEFTISNEGEAPLELTTGDTTCQCTSFSIDRNHVPPGESATVTVQWKAEREDAAFRHAAKVQTNDPDNTELIYLITGIVETSIITKPAGAWSAGNLNGTTPGVIKTTMFSRIIPDLTIESISTDSEFTTVEYVPMTESDLRLNQALSGWNFNLTIQPDFPVGKLEDILTVAFHDSKADDVQVPVHARRLGNIRISPMRGTRFSDRTRLISLGQFPASRGHESSLMLIVNQDNFDEELKILEVESDPNFLKVALEPMGKPNGNVARYRMNISVAPIGLSSKRSSSDPGSIRIVTNHPMETEIVIRATFNAF
ncbi:MAG: DUF1573 domain-containing protein [Fuerstiella sp.]|nr:DUF1573 domain-containing protein [Fuerstiella sp.]